MLLIIDNQSAYIKKFKGVILSGGRGNPFEVLAKSDTCPNEIIKHKELPIYGFQSHPEVSGREGMKMVENFLKICSVAS